MTGRTVALPPPLTSIPASVYCAQGGSWINPLPLTMNSALFTPHLEFTQDLGLTHESQEARPPQGAIFSAFPLSPIYKKPLCCDAKWLL